MSQIKFKNKITMSLGRNGLLNTIGVNISLDYNRLDENNNVYKVMSIQPITSKNEIGRCEIEIPVENIDELIEHLIFLRDDQPTTT